MPQKRKGRSERPAGAASRRARTDRPENPGPDTVL